jgi:hypothetical protein
MVFLDGDSRKNVVNNNGNSYMISAFLKAGVQSRVLAPLQQGGPHEICYFIAAGVSFCEKPACAALECSFTVFGNIVAGEYSHFDAGIGFFDYSREFQAVFARQPDIHENEVRICVFQFLERFITIGGLTNLQKGKPKRQHFFQRVSKSRIIFHKKNEAHFSAETMTRY